MTRTAGLEPYHQEEGDAFGFKKHKAKFKWSPLVIAVQELTDGYKFF